MRGVRVSPELLRHVLARAPKPLTPKIQWRGAELPDDAQFSQIRFSDGVCFANVRFGQRCLLDRAVFEGASCFKEAQFGFIANFERTNFGGDARFDHARFSEATSFTEAVFQKRVSFDHACFDDVDFINAEFEGPTSFSAATFTKSYFSKTQFKGGVCFTKAEFGPQTSFDGARLYPTACFKRARFGQTAFDRAKYPLLTGADLGDETSFKGARFGRATFAGAVFPDAASFAGSDTDFETVTFSGVSQCSVESPQITMAEPATFGANVSFAEATLGLNANFARVHFGPGANFSDSVFKHDASFAGADLGDRAAFCRTRFGRNVAFAERVPAESPNATAPDTGRQLATPAVFGKDVSFESATFGPYASFRGVDFGDRLSFDEAEFGADASFETASFGANAQLTRLKLEGNASFADSRFGEGLHLQIVKGGTISLQRAKVSRDSWLSAQCTVIDLTRGAFSNGLNLSTSAHVLLGGVELKGPSVIRGLEVPSEHDKSQRAAEDKLSPARLASLRDVDLANLRLQGVDLTACSFSGAYNLENVRLEEPFEFGEPPTGRRWTRRRVLRDEQSWRCQFGPKRVREKWCADGQPQQAERNLEARRDGKLARREAKGVQGLYRALRKSLEDLKNEPGAADFYYGEMEMRRHAAQRTSAEGLFLFAYWLVAGYALRGLRTVAAFFLVIALGCLAFGSFGFDKKVTIQYRPVAVDSEYRAPVYGTEKISDGRPGFRDAAVYSLQSATALLRPPSPQALTLPGQVVEVILRVLGPLLLGLAIFSVRGRFRR
jgi:uncharacterized protein YjbI with pentapeptide repeats